MTDSMYDRLGEMLSKALNDGEIPQEPLNWNESEAQVEDDSLASKIHDILQDNPVEENDEPESVSQENFQESSEIIREYLKNKKLKQEEQKKRNQNWSNGDQKNCHGRSQEKASANFKEFKFGTGKTQLMTPELQHCYFVLDIGVSATVEEVKKAYKDKLHYYHPDKHLDNPVLQKVATNKTREVVEAYNKIIAFLESR